MATNLVSQLEYLVSQMVERDLRRLNRPHRYSVGIIGLGNVGYQTAIKIVDLFPEVDRLILSNRTIEKCATARRELKGMKSAEDRHLEIDISDYRNLERMLKAEITVITAGTTVTRYGEEGRLGLLTPNLDIIRHIAEQFKGYEGAVIVATNPVAPLAYAFALYSGMDPAKVTGLTHLDTLRLRLIIGSMLESEYRTRIPKLEAFVIGAHEEGSMIPAYSQATLGTTQEGIPLTALKLVTNEFRKAARQETEAYGPKTASSLEGIGKTSALTAEAVAQVMRAIIEEDETVSAATLLPKGDAYAGWPVRFSGFAAIQQHIELSDGEQKEFSAAHERLTAFVSEMRSKGLISGYAEPREQQTAETEHGIADIRRLVEEIISSRYGRLEQQVRQQLERAFSGLEIRRGIPEGEAANLLQRLEAIEHELTGARHTAAQAGKNALRGIKVLVASRTNGQGGVCVVDFDGQNIEARLNTINSASGLQATYINGHKAILAGTRMGVQQWNPETLEVEKVYRAEKSDHRINSIGTISKDREQYIVGAARGDLYVWREARSLPARHVEGLPWISCAVVAGDRILTAGQGIYVLPFEGGHAHLQAGEVTCIASIDTGNGVRVFAGEMKGIVREWLYEKGKFTSREPFDLGNINIGYRVNCIACADIDGEAAYAVGTFGRGLKAYFPDNRQSIAFKGHQGDILSASLAKIDQEHYLAAGDTDGNLYIWNIKNPEQPTATIPVGRRIETVIICEL